MCISSYEFLCKGGIGSSLFQTDDEDDDNDDNSFSESLSKKSSASLAA